MEIVLSIEELSAKKFATEAHGSIGQLRKYTNEPYITHLEAVANIIRRVPNHTIEMLCAAWLHDVLEDTPTKVGRIIEVFGQEVADMVVALTDPPPEPGLNRKARKKLTMERLAKSSPEVKTVKLADLIHNTSSIIKYDPNFAKVYLEEKRQLLEVLREGDESLWNLAYTLAHKDVPCSGV